MNHSSHYSATLRLGLPIAIAQLGTIVLAFADTIMVGHYSTPALSAASFVNSLFNLATMIILGYSYGLTPFISSKFSQGSKAEVGAIMRRGLVANLVFGAAVLLCFGALFFLLPYLGQPSDLLPLMQSYYVTLWVSLWFVVIFTAARQFTDGITYTRLAMWLILAGNIVNIVLNYLLIFGISPFPEWGLFGAGFATMVSRILIAVVLLGIIFWGKRFADFRLPLSAEELSLLPSLREIHSKSWPVSLQIGLETFCFAGSAVMTGWLGKIPLASYQILMTLGTLGFTLYYSLGASMSIRIAYFLGQNDKAEALLAGKAGRNLLLLNATLSSMLFYFAGNVIVHLFTQDEAVITASLALLLPLVVYQFADALQICYANALRATQHVLPMTWSSAVAYLVVGMPAAYLMGFTLKGGVEGIFYSFAISLMVAALLFAFFYHRFMKAKY
mgnify:FL=1